ncbi:unnamed protein product [Rangifer tarandus platyrhynchus]|uniref:Uncharacterized protein n=1 Tax=Rangifer tarandus platyrhynchus TaxID=3082113 RepID=A0ABN8XMW4_RANTA|nr:unnamed protein product [Rangifer tarandus platyrhynchus]
MGEGLGPWPTGVPSRFPRAPSGQCPGHTPATPFSESPKPCPQGRPGRALGRKPHPRTDRRKRMQTSSGARASASGSHTRRFSFRRACEWNLIRRGAQGGQGAGRGAKRGEGARPPSTAYQRRAHVGCCTAQHGGQLRVRQDCVVVHGGQRTAEAWA